ncbi:MAG: DUF4383 domain-containing protein [Candidatus Andersenbacteria bacterium]
MLQKLAMILGVVLLALGILGYVPGITTDGMLLGIFAVNGPLNVIYLITGAAALWGSRSNLKNAKMSLQVLGVVYALLAVLGIFNIEGPLLGMLAHNMADLVLHVVLAAVALYAGFGMKAAMSPGMSSSQTPPMA